MYMIFKGRERSSTRRRDSHTRVAVYCDQDHIVCVDSYGKNWQEGTSEWYWKAGYSVINKWRFYNDVRELGIFDSPPGGALSRGVRKRPPVGREGFGRTRRKAPRRKGRSRRRRGATPRR